MKEIRSLISRTKLRGKNDAPTVYGRGITFDALSHDLGGFREKFSGQGKFTIDPSFRLLWNHDTGSPLASFASGLKIDQKRDGIYYSAPLLTGTTLGNDVLEYIRKGVAEEVSFGFVVDDNGDDWQMSKDSIVRTVNAATIFEISILGAQAAYSQNTVDVRRIPADIRTLIKRDEDAQDALDEQRAIILTLLKRRMNYV